MNGDSGITSEEDNTSAHSDGGSSSSETKTIIENNNTNDGVGEEEEDSSAEGMEDDDDVPHNPKTNESSSCIAGVGICGEEQQERMAGKKEEGEERGVSSSGGKRDDDSFPINNNNKKKRGWNDEDESNDDDKKRNKQMKPNGVTSASVAGSSVVGGGTSAGEEEEEESDTDKRTTDIINRKEDEEASVTKTMTASSSSSASASRPGLRSSSACSSSPPSESHDHLHHHANGRKRSSHSECEEKEEGEDEESNDGYNEEEEDVDEEEEEGEERDDDDDAAGVATVSDNKEARGNSDSSLRRLHSSLQMTFSSSSSGVRGESSTAAKSPSASASSLRTGATTAGKGAGEGGVSGFMDSNHSDNNFGNNSSHLQPSPKKKFKDDLTGEWVCPVCSKKMDSQHTFTVHIRQHNPTDHSHTCSICSKTLSSASSLDRHMLIHSGERPFRCRHCNMAFTTNGNMHRHMRTHGANDLLSDRSGRKAKPLRDNVIVKVDKRSLPDDGDSDHSNDSPGLESPSSRDLSPNSITDLTGSTATHPAFASTVKNLMNGKFPFPRSGFGSFFDLSFTDFSQKFPSIAQTYCEHNLRKSASPYHEYECVKCLRGFPAGSTLRLQPDSTAAAAASIAPSATFCGFCRVDLGSAEAFVKHVIQHQIEGLGLSSDEATSGFLRNNPFARSNEKEGFMAMLQLHNRDAGLLSSSLVNKNKDQQQQQHVSRTGDEHERRLSNNSKSRLIPGGQHVNSKSSSDHQHQRRSAKSDPLDPHHHKNMMREGSSSVESDAGKHDLADIQSIISVTKSGNHLKQIAAVSSSPASRHNSGSEGEEEEEEESNSDEASAAVPVADASQIMTAASSGKAVSDASSIGESKNKHSNSSSHHPEEEGGDEDKRDPGVESLTCKVCSIQFRNVAALKKHSRSHTQGSHNYSCHLCPYTSLDKSTLVRHLRTHNGERPFQCTICKYAFTTKANCERHVRKRHKKFSKQEIKTLMQYNTELNSSLTDIPIRKNNNDHQQQLHSGFPTKAPFKKSHVNGSTKSRPGDESIDSPDQQSLEMACKNCGHGFLSASELQRHKSTSCCNPSSLYVCSRCLCGFSNKAACLRHVRQIHPDLDEKLAILFNGETIAVNSCSSDFSDEESCGTKNGSLHSPSPRLTGSHQHQQQLQQQQPHVSSASSSSFPSMNLSHGSNNGKILDTQAVNQSLNLPSRQETTNSSLAALCHVANMAASPCKPLNLTSKPDSDDDEFDENNNDEQPFDLSVSLRRSNHHHPGSAFQPLDLALHALDLSVKANNACKSNQSLATPSPSQHSDSGNQINSATVADLSARKAADILLTLQSVAARNSFPPPHSGLFLPAALSSAQSAMAAALNQSSLLYPSAQQQLLHLQQVATGAVNSMSSSKIVPPHNPCISSSSNSSTSSKSERGFTCKICSAGFTLKSNMERHIKRKHVLS